MTQAPMLDSEFLAQLLPFNPFDPAFIVSPYPAYRRVREQGRLVRTPAGLWVVSGYELCAAVLRDSRFGWGDGAAVADHFSTAPDGSLVRPFIFSDPPEHTAIRRLVSKAFAARRIDQLRPTAQRLAAGLIAAAREQADDAPVDLMSAVAHPLPGQLLRELLGVPDEHEARFRVLTADIARGLDPSLFLTPDEIAKRDSARAELGEVFTALAERRRSDPGDDLISQLLAVEDEGHRLTMHELQVTCTLLLAAGYATTHGLIANGMLALLQRPAQRDWLRANPDRVEDAVEEMLRFDAPVQMIARMALTEVTLDDHVIQPGEQVMLLIGAANRDPAVFEDPDELLLSRENPRNLGFGLGIHFCLGAPLARLTAQAAVAELAALDIELATGTPPRVPNIIMRSLAELPVRIAGR